LHAQATIHRLWGNSSCTVTSEKIDEISGNYVEDMQANNTTAESLQTDELCSRLSSLVGGYVINPFLGL
jgi:hypothetical protein